ncbi:MAG: von Willebrand factor type A domain-containing protein [Agriterribacter sp.]
MKYILFCSAIVIASLVAFLPKAPLTIKGKVTNARGEALKEIGVAEKGTGNIKQTDSTGYFELTVKKSDAVLIFSGLGYATQEVNVAGKSTINVVLLEDNKSMDEVVVIGYAPQKKVSMTGVALVGKASGIVADRAPSPYPTMEKDMMAMADKEYFDDRKGYNSDSITAFNREGYDGIVENSFKGVKENPLSTFSIDVDAASYSNVRRFLNQGQLPPAGAVRIEEMINYFHYQYAQPNNNEPFAITTELSEAPWNKTHRLMLVSLQGKKVSTENIPASNIVFLIDVSGSMEDENKLPLVKQSMKMLTDQLRPQDKVAMVVYAGNAGVVLPATSGSNKQTIKNAIDRLEAGGSTAGGEGIKLAYKIAKENFVKDGNNRIVLCTDGDFNVGMSSDADMETLIEQERKSGVFLTVLGYGMGNYQDSKMQKLADKGNGNHAYIDNLNEAKKVLVSEFGGTMFTIAKDVKLQIEFNPAKVQAYRLIGYENRMLNKEDFNNDKKDAGDLGSGHTVTALYEIIPVGVANDFAESVDPLKYQPAQDKNAFSSASAEWMNIKLRYKKPDGDVSRLLQHPVVDNGISISNTSDNFRFAAAVAQFGMILRNSSYKQQSSYNGVLALANSAKGNDEEGYRKEFIELVQKAGSIAKRDGDPKEDDRVGKK